MFRYLIRIERVSLIAFGLLLVGLACLAPAAPGPRAWVFIAGSLLMPTLCVGRMQRRLDAGWWNEARSLGGRITLYGLDSLFIVLPALLFGTLAGAGQFAPSVAMALWVLALMGGADLLDRWASDVRQAWLGLWSMVILGLTAPLWLAPLFGQTALAPALATWAIGLHPAAMTLGAFGLPTLQDPVFYHLTLSGVVEVRPLWWGWGAIFYAGIIVATLGVCFLVRRGHNAAQPLMD